MNPKSIEYLVQTVPDEVDRLIYAEGYQPPENNDERLWTLKELVRLKGSEFLKALADIHPDRSLIMQDKGEHDNFCGACAGFANYTGDAQLAPLGDLTKMSIPNLEGLRGHYQHLVSVVPDDPRLKIHLDAILKELANRAATSQPQKKEAVAKSMKTRDWVAVGICSLLALGLLVSAIGGLSNG